MQNAVEGGRAAWGKKEKINVQEGKINRGKGKRTTDPASNWYSFIRYNNCIIILIITWIYTGQNSSTFVRL